MNFIAQLLAWLLGKPAARAPDMPDEVPSTGEPAWLKLARAELGTKEAPGEANNPKVLKYYADAGHPEINADSVAWCAAFAGAMLERAGTSCSKQLNARSYLTWGKPVTKPYPGCVAVFSRGDPRGWEGHVGFFLEQSGDSITILAGNQGDAVSIGKEPASRLLGFREPVTAMNSRTLKASAAGLLGDTMMAAGMGGKVAESLPDALALSESVKGLAAYWPWFAVIGIGIGIAARVAVIAARMSDLSEKGR